MGGGGEYNPTEAVRHRIRHERAKGFQTQPETDSIAAPGPKVTAATDTPECAGDVRFGKARVHAWGGSI